jgi:hypothetical protein
MIGLAEAKRQGELNVVADALDDRAGEQIRIFKKYGIASARVHQFCRVRKPCPQRAGLSLVFGL